MRKQEGKLQQQNATAPAINVSCKKQLLTFSRMRARAKMAMASEFDHCQ
jgi:hypothetical protein